MTNSRAVVLFLTAVWPEPLGFPLSTERRRETERARERERERERGSSSYSSRVLIREFKTTLVQKK